MISKLLPIKIMYVTVRRASDVTGLAAESVWRRGPFSQYLCLLHEASNCPRVRYTTERRNGENCDANKHFISRPGKGGKFYMFLDTLRRSLLQFVFLYWMHVKISVTSQQIKCRYLLVLYKAEEVIFIHTSLPESWFGSSQFLHIF